MKIRYVERLPSIELEDPRSKNELINLVNGTLSRSEDIFEDGLNSKIGLWNDNNRVNWNSTGRNIIADAAGDRLKFTPIYQKAQSTFSDLLEKSRIPHVASIGAFYAVRLFTFPFEKSSEWAEDAKEKVNVSFDLNIGTDPYDPYIRSQKQKYDIMLRPGELLIGAGRTGEERLFLTKIDPLGSLGFRFIKSIGKTRAFLGAEVDGGMDIGSLQFNPREDSRWKLHGGIIGKTYWGFNFVLDVRSTSHISSNESGYSASILLNKEI